MPEEKINKPAFILPSLSKKTRLFEEKERTTRFAKEIKDLDNNASNQIASNPSKKNTIIKNYNTILYDLYKKSSPNEKNYLLRDAKRQKVIEEEGTKRAKIAQAEKEKEATKKAQQGADHRADHRADQRTEQRVEQCAKQFAKQFAQQQALKLEPTDEAKLMKKQAEDAATQSDFYNLYKDLEPAAQAQLIEEDPSIKPGLLAEANKRRMKSLPSWARKGIEKIESIEKEVTSLLNKFMRLGK